DRHGRPAALEHQRRVRGGRHPEDAVVVLVRPLVPEVAPGVVDPGAPRPERDRSEPYTVWDLPPIPPWRVPRPLLPLLEPDGVAPVPLPVESPENVPLLAVQDGVLRLPHLARGIHDPIPDP